MTEYASIVGLALALASCSPKPTGYDNRYAIEMLRRGYPEWVARCAWSDGREGIPLQSALRRCQMDLGLRSPSLQTAARIEIDAAELSHQNGGKR
ncbi:hypothetical protein [Novosphingobium sp. SG720]|uniref:hypothetical protein n=1 Tax=Novosphingobium sp. SG720 TaxID=2586998 RepID=UPI0014456625|nr:hypothetical protein [Novosphingobium sp. SG720]NKJ43156.1 hypothetical protein [Novosphingobium sp. SG720]